MKSSIITAEAHAIDLANKIISKSKQEIYQILIQSMSYYH